MTDLFVVSRFVATAAVTDGLLVAMDYDEIVWAGPAAAIPDRVMEGGAGIRRMHVHPDYLARLQARLAQIGEGTPCPHREVWAVASPDRAHAFECRDCGARVAGAGEQA